MRSTARWEGGEAILSQARGGRVPSYSGRLVAMPMTQQDILAHYEKQWKTQADAASDLDGLAYSNPVEDAVLYPVYQRLIAELNMRANGGRVLDVGSGSGRWVRFFLESYRPRLLMGIDYSEASVEVLKKWHRGDATRLEFRQADITRPGLDLGGTFDLVNVANVLFHIPEPGLFTQALANLGRLVESDGFIVTTEYLPRCTMRTEWMLVRSRYEFDAAVAAAGLCIAEVRAFSFFANDPMGLDGPDHGVRGQFHKARAGMTQLLSSKLDLPARRFLIGLFADIERAALAFCRERVPDLDLPSQKLVVLKRSK
jgi:SAM-dependent methyltransferase